MLREAVKKIQTAIIFIRDAEWLIFKNCIYRAVNYWNHTLIAVLTHVFAPTCFVCVAGRSHEWLKAVFNMLLTLVYSQLPQWNFAIKWRLTTDTLSELKFVTGCCYLVNWMSQFDNKNVMSDICLCWIAVLLLYIVFVTASTFRVFSYFFNF